MKNLLFLTSLLLSLNLSFAADYYTITDGNWDQASVWSLSPNGPSAGTLPGAYDNIVIAHVLAHEAGTGYIHYGNVTVQESGDYRISTGNGKSDPYYFAGARFEIFGRLWTSSDFQHQLPWTNGNGLMAFQQGSLVEIGDDLILNAQGRAILNTFECGNAYVVDDIYFIGSQSQMCGTGHFIVPDKLRAWNDNGYEVFPASSQIANQLCNGFGLYASESNCRNGIPEVTGGGPFDLPVEFLAVDAQWVGQTVQLDWSTASETNNDFFTVERSIDGQHFQTLTEVAGAGTTQEITTYQFTDAQPLATQAYYRIKQVDFDGQFSYSSLIELSLPVQMPQLIAFPNPTSGSHLTLRGLPTQEVFTIQLTQLNGQLISETLYQGTLTGELFYSLSPTLAPGCYFLSVQSETQVSSLKIWLQ